MTPFLIQTLPDLETVAREIGADEGRDFSFLALFKGRILKSTVQHWPKHNGRFLGDIVPASRYTKKGL